MSSIDKKKLKKTKEKEKKEKEAALKSKKNDGKGSPVLEKRKSSGADKPVSTATLTVTKVPSGSFLSSVSSISSSSEKGGSGIKDTKQSHKDHRSPKSSASTGRKPCCVLNMLTAPSVSSGTCSIPALYSILGQTHLVESAFPKH